MSLTTHTECHLSGLFESNCSCYRRLDLYKQIIALGTDNKKLASKNLVFKNPLTTRYAKL